MPAKPTLQRHADAAFVLLAALFVTLPLLLRGNSCGHDQVFHLISWLEAANQWKHGTLRPFWAFHPAWHAGEPRFVFYPPLSWALGAMLGLILPWTAALTAYTFVATAIGGLTMRALLRRFVSPTLAAAGACVYVANPYLLFVVYERAAYAELLAAAWMPLLLLCVLQRKLQPLHLAIVVALLWLTNAPAAIVGSYALLLLAVVRLIQSARTTPDAPLKGVIRESAQLTGGYVLGLGLAGFFLVPALAQRSFVQLAMAVIPGMRPADSFLFEHTGQEFHDAVLRSASFIAVVLLGLAIVSAVILLLRQRRHHAYRSMKSRETAGHAPSLHQAVTALALLSVVILFLLTPLSAAVWRHAPQLAFLQFPWRFLTIETAVAALLLTLVAASFQLRGRTALFLALALAAGLSWFANTHYRQPCDDEDAPPARVAAFQSGQGIDPTDEYTPTDDDNDTLQQDLPPAWLAADAQGAPTASADLLSLDDGDPSHLHFDVRPAPQARTLVIRLRAYPGWRLQFDGASRALPENRDDGLIAIDLPANAPHSIDLRYRWTADEYAGLALSLAAFATLAVLWNRRSPQSRRIDLNPA